MNSIVTYSIVPDALGFSSRFRINSITGWIYNVVPLDREEEDTYSLLVRATDNAKKVEDRRYVKFDIVILFHDRKERSQRSVKVYGCQII